MFINNLKAPSKLHWQTKVWVEGSVKEDVVLFEDIPQGMSTYSTIRYIHIRARTLPCEFLLLGASDVPARDASPGLYVKLKFDHNTTGYIRIFPSTSPSPSLTPSSPYLSSHPAEENVHRAILLPFALAALPSNTYFDVVDGMASVMIVKDMGDWWERVGVGFVCTRVLGFEGGVAGEVAFFGVEEGGEGEGGFEEGDGEMVEERVVEEEGGDDEGDDEEDGDGKRVVELRKGWIGMQRFLELGRWGQEGNEDEGDEERDVIGGGKVGDGDSISDGDSRSRKGKRFLKLGGGCGVGC